MRISTHYNFSSALQNMLQQQSRLQETEAQIGSGLRLLQPADDPSGAVSVINLEDNLSQMEQYASNGNLASNELARQETTLNGVIDALQRVRELTVQAANASNQGEPREAIARELDVMLEEMLGLANTRDSNGDYIFAGSLAGEPAFARAVDGSVVYQGDQATRQLQVGEASLITVRESGAEMFERIPARSGDGPNSSLFTTLQSLVTAVAAPVATDLERDTFDQAMAGGLEGVDDAIEHLSRARSALGARMNLIDGQAEVNADLTLQLESVRSDIQDLDYTEALGRFNTQLTALQAAQAAYAKVQGLSLFSYL